MSDGNSNPVQAKQEILAVANDMEMAEGVFVVGGLYHVRTPTYQYVGILSLVTPTVFVFDESATVYETGPYPAFYAGNGTQVEPHVGAGQMIVDRAATVMHFIPRKHYKPQDE